MTVEEFPASHAATATTARPWGQHVRGTVLLALPLIGTQLAQMAMHVTDTVMLGWLGAAELAASVLATQALLLVFMFGSGFSHAMVPLAAAAEGSGDTAGVRRAIRMGAWVLVLYSALGMVPLWHIEAILLALGQQPALAAMAGDYMRVVLWSLPFALLVQGFRAHLSVVGRAWVVLLVVASGAVCNGVLNWIFIFGNLGAPMLGIVGAALATALTTLAMTTALAVWEAADPALRRYALFARLWRPDRRPFLDVLRLGWPIGATIVAEVGLFAAASVMMGWLGAIALAAHGIALQIASFAFMVPLGLASAATVRVGLAFGRGNGADLARAGHTALVMATAFACGSAAVFWLWPDTLIGLYLDRANANAAAVLAYGVPLLLIAAAFQLVDSLQAVASGMLRGMKDTRTPMLIALFSYWIVGMPAAWLLGFRAGLGGPGIWIGLATGLALAAILLNVRFLLRERLGLMAADTESV